MKISNKVIELHCFHHSLSTSYFLSEHRDIRLCLSEKSQRLVIHLLSRTQKMVVITPIPINNTEAQKEIEVANGNNKKAKRTSCPGIRVKGNRIYDSENGITCHQVFLVRF